MDRCTYPFPLAVNSSHHSHYHRFLLGADPSVVAPFPKPYCVGAMRGVVSRLAQDMDLPRWRKLYHGAIPWLEGFSPEHYDLGNVAPHCPFPRVYGRPHRRFGAFDFVQVADPSLSALALVAGDRRILDRFVALGDDFCARIQPGAAARGSGPLAARTTGRMLAGQFVEPNNRWLMPLLHVHSRVLNFTSFEEAPGRLSCLDASSLARSARREKGDWIARQAEILSDLGYGAAVRGETSPSLHVDGVSSRLVAAMEAPRIAVLRLLERIIVGERPPSVVRLGAELPPEVIAALAEQLESVLARSLSCYKPAKIALPSEGPWRAAVRERLGQCCPDALAKLDAAALHARAVPSEATVFCVPPLDPSHSHAPWIGAVEAQDQKPTDPELGARPDPIDRDRTTSAWLAREFALTLSEVNERIIRGGPSDPLVGLRGMLATIDQLPGAADPEQLRQAELLIGVELDRRSRQHAVDPPSDRMPFHAGRFPLTSIDELFEGASRAPTMCAQEIGGRSL